MKLPREPSMWERFKVGVLAIGVLLGLVVLLAVLLVVVGDFLALCRGFMPSVDDANGEGQALLGLKPLQFLGHRVILFDTQECD